MPTRPTPDRPFVDNNTKIATIATIALLVAVAIAVVVTIVVQNSTAGDTAANAPSSTVRADTRYLDQVGGADDKVTVVEFLDFECESCAAAYPVVESLRDEFDGEIDVAIRYFPIPSHFNSQNAAVAVEAAARQGALEPMYSAMYETQASWGEQQVSMADLFREFAVQLELDLEQYDADVADPAVVERVQSDFADGVALGVESTPTFFVDDEKVDLRSWDDLRTAVTDALAS